MRNLKSVGYINTAREEISATELREELSAFLQNKVVILDCGHRFCLHNFSNTLIIYNNGNMVCHNCGY